MAVSGAACIAPREAPTAAAAVTWQDALTRGGQKGHLHVSVDHEESSISNVARVRLQLQYITGSTQAGTGVSERLMCMACNLGFWG